MKHYQLIFGAVSILSLFLVIIMLGIFYKRGDVGRNYLYVLIALLIPLVFNGVGIWTSIHFSADNYVNWFD